MVRRADVLLENFSPGTMDGLGVGWSVLKELNPRLIYATGTGFGISGPDRDNLAMDLTIQAASGIMSVTGAPDGPPMKAGPTLVDFMGGIHLYGAIMTALFERERSGEGRLVEVAMQETVYPSLAASFEYYHRTGQPPPRTGNRQAGLSTAPYNVYPTADGHVAIHIVTEGHWKNLTVAMGREDLQTDPRFVTNADRIAHMDEIDAEIGGVDADLGQDGDFRPLQGRPGAGGAGAHRARGDERPAYARTRHAGTRRPSGAGRDRGADEPAAAARAASGADAPEPDRGPAQCRDLRRLARPVGR